MVGNFGMATTSTVPYIIRFGLQYVMEGKVRHITKICASNIKAAGTPQPNLGDAVRSSVYSNGTSSIFLSETSFTQSLLE